MQENARKQKNVKKLVVHCLSSFAMSFSSILVLLAHYVPGCPSLTDSDVNKKIEGSADMIAGTFAIGKSG